MGSESAAVLRIVLIEDNPSDVYLMTLALEESGLKFDLTNFQSGADALLSLCPGAGSPSVSAVPDIILLDLNTPRSDGFEVLASIRGDDRLAFVPIAIVTSSSSPADQRRAESLGATTYIKKPTQLTAFIDDVGTAVRRVLATARPPARAAGSR
jgi:chemotaxis family two-component system response regulator Rcp1